MLDNVDSFTYNLVDEFHVLGFEPVIYRNTLPADFILAQMEACTDQVLLVLSPGPGSPKNAGCLMELLDKAVGKYPILGICLGHQALIEHYGGKVGRAPEIVHGKSANVKHSATGAFKNIEQPLPVARYHSLVGLEIPEALTVIAEVETTTGDTLTMAVEHLSERVMGFQFHPESILTTYGSTLLEQSIRCLTEQTSKESS